MASSENYNLIGSYNELIMFSLYALCFQSQIAGKYFKLIKRSKCDGVLSKRRTLSGEEQ